MKRAFTLVELIIVIGIIAILSAVLLGTFGTSRESANATRCLANLKNLANAVSSYTMSAQHYPYALSVETSQPDLSDGMANAKLRYYEIPGWISWYSKGLYPSDASQKGSCRTIGLYSDVVEDVQYAIENGALYKYTAGNKSTYLCPEHKKKFPTANWSYFMNTHVSGHRAGRKFSIAGRAVGAEHVLLFAEVPFQGSGAWFPSGTEGNEETDPAIQYENENIGCNHKSGKLSVAHVVFCDGHVEKLRAANRSADVSASNLKEATEWLCQGYDIAFANGAFQKIDGADEADQTE